MRALTNHPPTRPQDVVIVGAARTPIGSIGGLLSSVKGPELGATAIRAALAQAGLTPAQVTEVIMGNVVSAGVGQAPARQASMLAGIPVSAVCTTVNKVCASGMKSIALGAQSIMLGHSDVVVAGGFESMSHVPYYLPGARAGMRYGHGQVLDGIVKDGLWDVYNEIPMGSCAEKTAKEGGHSRADQDAFARLSYERAAAATKAGYFKGEVAGVLVKGKKGDVTVRTGRGEGGGAAKGDCHGCTSFCLEEEMYHLVACGQSFLSSLMDRGWWLMHLDPQMTRGKSGTFLDRRSS